MIGKMFSTGKDVIRQTDGFERLSKLDTKIRSEQRISKQLERM